MLHTFRVSTRKKTELQDITHLLRKAVDSTNVKDGIAVIYVPHTTAAVTINENADPSVKADILYELNKIVPLSDNYTHLEGNSAAHIKSSLTGTSQTIIIKNGSPVLGTWQGLFFCEFDGPRIRSVHIKVMGN